MSRPDGAADFDGQVRAAIARSIRDLGRIPLIEEVAAELKSDASLVDASFVRMSDGHMFIPHRDSHEIHAYNPFCVGPTAFRVNADGRQWWGICGWDALGIPPALGVTGQVETACADRCGQQIVVEVGLGGRANAQHGAVLHVGVPARSFWDDIYFT